MIPIGPIERTAIKKQHVTENNSIVDLIPGKTLSADSPNEHFQRQTVPFWMRLAPALWRTDRPPPNTPAISRLTLIFLLPTITPQNDVPNSRVFAPTFSIACNLNSSELKIPVKLRTGSVIESYFFIVHEP